MPPFFFACAEGVSPLFFLRVEEELAPFLCACADARWSVFFVRTEDELPLLFLGVEGGSSLAVAAVLGCVVVARRKVMRPDPLAPKLLFCPRIALEMSLASMSRAGGGQV